MPSFRIAALRLAAPIVLASAVFTPTLMASPKSVDWHVVAAANAMLSHGTGTTFEPVAIDAVVVVGDRLTTKSGGTVVLARGQDLVTMAENTQIFIVDPQPMNGTVIEQPYGKAQYHVTKEKVPHFEVDTPLLATIVKGTTFTVNATATEGAVTVSEGRVVAKDRRSGNNASVGAGQTGSVANAGRNVSVADAKPGDAGVSAQDESSNATSPDSDSQGKDKDKSGDSGSSGGGKDKNNSGSSGSGSGGNSGNGGGNSGNGGGNGNGNNGNGNGNGGGNGGGNGNGNGNGNGGHGHGGG